MEALKKLNEELEKVLNEFNTAIEDNEKQEIEEYLGTIMDNASFEWKRENDNVIFTKDSYKIIYEQEAYPVPILTIYKDGKIIDQQQIFNREQVEYMLWKLDF